MNGILGAAFAAGPCDESADLRRHRPAWRLAVRACDHVVLSSRHRCQSDRRRDFSFSSIEMPAHSVVARETHPSLGDMIAKMRMTAPGRVEPLVQMPQTGSKELRKRTYVNDDTIEVSPRGRGCFQAASLPQGD